MKALIVHNSDEIKACFVGQTEKEILEKIKQNPQYWEDVTDRLAEETDGELNEANITMGNISSLVQYGDSDNCYTLIETF